MRGKGLGGMCKHNNPQAMSAHIDWRSFSGPRHAESLKLRIVWHCCRDMEESPPPPGRSRQYSETSDVTD